MACQYIATPATAAGALTEVATTTSLLTVLQVLVPANKLIQVLGWGISDTGVVGTDPPGEAYLIDTTAVVATVTSLTPSTWGNPNDPASVCVGGTSATGYNASAEGTITASRVLDTQKVHPQTGYSCWFPSDARPRVGGSAARCLRIRVLFTVSYNCVPWVVWDE